MRIGKGGKVMKTEIDDTDLEPFYYDCFIAEYLENNIINAKEIGRRYFDYTDKRLASGYPVDKGRRRMIRELMMDISLEG
jgi:hypothetical protein